MTLKNAAFFAFIGMTLLTVACVVGFIADISALLAGAIAPMLVLNSLIHLLASLSVAVFLYMFHKTQSLMIRETDPAIARATIETSPSRLL